MLKKHKKAAEKSVKVKKAAVCGFDIGEIFVFLCHI